MQLTLPRWCSQMETGVEQAAVTKVEQQMLIEHKMWCSDLYIPPFAKGKHRRIKEEEKVSASNKNKDFEIYVY